MSVSKITDVGAGPQRILSNNLISRLEALHKTIVTTIIGPVDEYEGEIGRSFELIRRVSVAVSNTVKNGMFPIILAGNCNTSVGVAAGLSGTNEGLEVVWFDAHSDLANPDETKSGYFDGMGTSMMSGESWKGLMAMIPGHRLISLKNFIFCGVRDLNEGQFRKLGESKARAVFGNRRGENQRIDYAIRLYEEFENLGRGDEKVYLVHVDLDCLDDSIGNVNEYASSGGLQKNDLLDCLDVVADRRRPVALTIASFNPHLGGGDTIAEIAVKAILKLVSQL
jgi:arginase